MKKTPRAFYVKAKKNFIQNDSLNLFEYQTSLYTDLPMGKEIMEAVDFLLNGEKNTLDIFVSELEAPDNLSELLEWAKTNADAVDSYILDNKETLFDSEHPTTLYGILANAWETNVYDTFFGDEMVLQYIAARILNLSLNLKSVENEKWRIFEKIFENGEAESWTLAKWQRIAKAVFC